MKWKIAGATSVLYVKAVYKMFAYLFIMRIECEIISIFVVVKFEQKELCL